LGEDVVGVGKEISSEVQRLTENGNARLAVSAFVISTLVLAVWRPFHGTQDRFLELNRPEGWPRA